MSDAHGPGLDDASRRSGVAPRGLWLVGLFLLAMATELYVPTAANWWPRPIDGEEPFIAVHLYHGQGFLSPLDPSPNAPPSSWSPPLYPALLSVFYHLFSTNGPRLRVPLMFLQAIFFGLATIGLFRLGELLFSRAIGVGAAVAHAVYPAFLHTAADFWDNYAALALFVWLLVAVALLRQRQAKARDGAALGLGLGILSLTNASYVLAYPVLVLAAVVRRKMSGKFAFTGAALLVFLLTLTPWTIRNYRQFGRIFYVRDGVKLEIWLGNHADCTGWWFSHIIREYHPTHNADERAALLGLGETAYFDSCLSRFKEEYAADPVAFWKRTASRAAFCLTGEPPRPTRKISKMSLFAYDISGLALDPLNAALSLLGLIGGVLAWRCRYRCGWVMASGALAVTPFLVASVSARYLLPWRVVLLFFAMFAVVAPVQRMIKGRWPRPLA